MKLRVTSITASEVGSIVSKVTVLLEDKFNSFFESKSYGYSIDQFTIIVISVDDDPLENSKYFCEKYRRNSYKDYFSDEKIHYLEVGILIPPNDLLTHDPEIIIKSYIQNNIADFLSKVPQKFDSTAFLIDFLKALDQ